MASRNNYTSRNCNTGKKGCTYKNSIIASHILDDLCSRFIINMPKDQLDDPVRICFQLELAYWFYWDNYEEEINKCSLSEFITIIFNYLPVLKNFCNNVDDVMKKWRNYKSEVPTYGAVLMDAELENVVLVQGDFAKASWGFPKGKVNEGESPYMCAIREVREETGCDISNFVNPNLYFERKIHDTTVRLYFVRGIDRHFPFKPETKNEIRDIRWFFLSTLPDKRVDYTKSRFFGVIPFVEPIKRYIRHLKGEKNVSPVQTGENSTSFGYYVQNGGHSTPNIRQYNHNNNNVNEYGSPSHVHFNDNCQPMTPKSTKYQIDRRRTQSMSTSNFVKSQINERAMTSPLATMASPLATMTLPLATSPIVANQFQGNVIAITPQALLNSASSKVQLANLMFHGSPSAFPAQLELSKTCQQTQQQPLILQSTIRTKYDKCHFSENTKYNSVELNVKYKNGQTPTSRKSVSRNRYKNPSPSNSSNQKRGKTLIITATNSVPHSDSSKTTSQGEYAHTTEIQNSSCNGHDPTYQGSPKRGNVAILCKQRLNFDLPDQPQAVVVKQQQEKNPFDLKTCRKQQNDNDVRLADKWSDIRFDWSAVLSQL